MTTMKLLNLHSDMTSTQAHSKGRSLSSALCSFVASSLLLLSGISTEAQAESADARHYRVEMVVFSYETPDKNLSESWPENTQLELPTAYLNLYSLSEVTPELLQKTQATTDTKTISNELGETERVEYPVGVMPLSQQQRVDLRSNRLPDLFLLPDDLLQLSRQRDRLARRDNFRIMYHQAWNMPIYDRENSIPIHIKGGEQYDNLFELEGSIRLSVARYLHLDTQLYLREFEANQTPGQSRLPGFSELTSNPNSATPLLQGSNATPNPSLALLGLRQYRVSTIIPLKQSRRMRSGDLHYIDHPRYGILIQLTPYNPDEEPIRIK